MPDTETHHNGYQLEFGLPQALFHPGIVGWTSDVQLAFLEANQLPIPFLQRHLTGDWGEMPEAYQFANVQALALGYPVLSAYRLKTNTKFLVVTEGNRSATTFVMPQEYWQGADL